MITNDDLDDVFGALSNRVRRRILDILHETPGESVGTLANQFEISRIAIMNHLKILEEAQLVTSQKQGRTRRLYINIMPIQAIHERWSDTYSGYWADRLSFIKLAAEQAARSTVEPAKPTRPNKPKSKGDTGT